MRIKLGVALLAALVFSAVMTSSAFGALSFLSTISKAKLLSEKVENQVFVSNGGTVECAEAKIIKGETGTAGAEEAAWLAEIQYEDCVVFGFLPNTFTPADLLFLPSGTVHLDKEIKVLAGGCELTFPPQLFGTDKFATSGHNVKVEQNVTGILYTIKNCVTNGTAKNGTLKGNFEVMIAGGSVSFMP